jgi:hypothetical protein
MLWILLTVACNGCSGTSDTALNPGTKEPVTRQVAPPPPLPPQHSPGEADEGPPPPPDAEELGEDSVIWIGKACEQLNTCGCNQGQTVEQCTGSAGRSGLPFGVYKCIAFQPCETLCAPGPSGSADKGLTPCVKPYLEGTMDVGRGLGNRPTETRKKAAPAQ